jgi:uncharacterized protein YndB with AHSA1/START domain
MGFTTVIGPLAVRRSIWIDAPPARVWEHFADLEHMQAWFGTGHELTAYACEVGAPVEIVAGPDTRFVGAVTVVEPERELTFEEQWVGNEWPHPTFITVRLHEVSGGTLVELLHHGFDALGADAGPMHDGFEHGWTMRQLDALRDLVAR